MYNSCNIMKYNACNIIRQNACNIIKYNACNIMKTNYEVLDSLKPDKIINLKLFE